MEETTSQVLEVVAVVQPQPELYLILGFITACLLLIYLSVFFNR